MKIVFFGTPEFAVVTLDAIIKAGYEVSAIVTAPDKPKGRGQQMHESDVKIYAKQNGLKILQPHKLKDPDFNDELNSLNADLFVVVAFRMMPESIWNMPPKGTINLHGSLLPQYRGAAPINWAIINGEKQTGVSTFFLTHEIDTGNLIFQKTIDIKAEDNAGTIHDKLMNLGARLIVETLKSIEKNDNPCIPQKEIIKEALKHAPKIFKLDCLIDWNKNSTEINNQIRGLSPYPTAFTALIDDKGNVLLLKIFEAKINELKLKPGEIFCDEKCKLIIGTQDSSLSVLDLQIAGKKRMKIEEFLRGFNAKRFKIQDSRFED